LCSAEEMSSRKQQGALIPGFFLPLKWQQEEDRTRRHSYNVFLNSALDGSEEGYGCLRYRYCYIYWCCYSGDGPDPLTVAERLVLSLMNEITDNLGWHQKVSDKQWTEQWKRQKLSQHANLTPRMAEWVRWSGFVCNDQADLRAVCSRSAGKNGSISRITVHTCSRSRSM